MSIRSNLSLLIAAVTSLAASPGVSEPAAALAPSKKPPACKPVLHGSEAKESTETLQAIRDLPKDGASGIPAEARGLLDQMTAMLENDDSRNSAEMAEAMREFAGGRATRRQRC